MVGHNADQKILYLGFDRGQFPDACDRRLHAKVALANEQISRQSLLSPDSVPEALEMDEHLGVIIHAFDCSQILCWDVLVAPPCGFVVGAGRPVYSLDGRQAGCLRRATGNPTDEEAPSLSCSLRRRTAVAARSLVPCIAPPSAWRRWSPTESRCRPAVGLTNRWTISRRRLAPSA